MKIKVILFGSTGMIGQAVLLECLENNEVESVLVINRHTCNITHLKLKEIIHENFFHLSALTNVMAGYDTCFFCLGVSAAGLSEKNYHRITYELTLSVAETLLKIKNDFVFCYISGAQTDSSEKGRMMWARVKGKTENALLALPFKKAALSGVYPLRNSGSGFPCHGVATSFTFAPAFIKNLTDFSSLRSIA